MKRLLSSAVAAGALLSLTAAPVFAEEASAEMYSVSEDGIGESLGTVQLSDGADGLTLAVDVQGLTPGEHGFHLHQNGSCEPAANAEGQMTAALGAGGHYDPEGTAEHAGPEGEGHRATCRRSRSAATAWRWPSSPRRASRSLTRAARR